MDESLYRNAKLRLSIPLFFFAGILPIAIEEVLRGDQLLRDDSSMLSLAFFLSGYLILFVCYWLCWCRSHTLRTAFGQFPATDARTKLLLLVPALFAISMFTVYLVFYPLSISHPQWVESWLLDMPEILRPMDEIRDIRYNVANILAVVVFAPVVEEFVFRGFLLGRMQKKFGLKPAMVLSSILFAILHGEILGAFIFGIFMCLLRYQYRSLWAPTIVHMANNLLVTLIVFIDQILLANHYEYTIEEFQSYWWIGVIGMIYGVPALFYYYRRYLSQVMMAQSHVI